MTAGSSSYFATNTHLTVVLARSRPAAYICSRAYSEIAEDLRILKIEVVVVKIEFQPVSQVLNVLNETRHFQTRRTPTRSCDGWRDQ